MNSALSDSSGSPNLPPPSTATRQGGEKPSNDRENNSSFFDHPAAPSTGQIDAILSRLTSYAGADVGADPPIPPAKIAASLDHTNQEIKESIKSIQRDDDAAVPLAQICADLKGMNAAIKGSLKTPPNTKDVPMHPSQIATGFHEMEIAMKENDKDANNSGSGTDPTLLPSQMAALAEEMVEEDDG